MVELAAMYLAEKRGSFKTVAQPRHYLTMLA
jgi:hypothetical protein